MRPISALARGKGLGTLFLGGTGGFAQKPFWAQPDMVFSPLLGDRERVEDSFEGYVAGAYKANGVVFACVLARLLLFSEARFLWRRMENGRPTSLFGNPELAVLERPWENGTTGELLARMEQDVSLAGNSFWTTVGSGANRRLRRLRPDWVTIVTGSEDDDPFALDARPVGYVYEPRGDGFGRDPVVLDASRVVHYSPIPNPVAQWRGMSWITPVVREVDADSAATNHKAKFFENGATGNLAVTYDKDLHPDVFKEYVRLFNQEHGGVDNAYRTYHFGGGADAKVVGADLKQLDFKVTQGAGETRVSAAAGVPPIIVGLSEGLDASTYSNYGQARRKFADHYARPHWRMAAAALEKILTSPGGSAQLWYDDRDIPFLREDAAEESKIVQQDAISIRQLIEAGLAPDAVVRAVVAKNLSLLEGEHTGLTSAQLRPADKSGPDGETL